MSDQSDANTNETEAGHSQMTDTKQAMTSRPIHPSIKPPVPSGQRNPGMSHDDAKRIIEGRTLPSKIFNPAQIQPSGPILSAVAPGYASTVTGAPDLDELARALKNNVDLIYEFVGSNIDFLPTFGSQKGAWGTLVDGLGNSFDQAELMIELLRKAGYTASFVFGELELTLAQASDWLGTSTTDIWASANLLSEGFIPNSVVAGKLRLSHCWVKCTISGTEYHFDPAKKAYTAIAGVNLATAMGYNQTTFMNNARSGATINANYVQNMHRSNIRSNLQTYTTNLVTWIKNNAHGSSTDQILGGKTIVPITGQLRQTSLPYLRPGTTPTVWTNIPNSYNATLHVLYDSPNIDQTFFSKDIHGKRLTITFNASHQAELRLDGTLIDTSSAQTPGSWNSVLLEPKHPYASTAVDQSFWMTVWCDKPYLIAQSWGNAGRKMLELHQGKLKQNRFNGAADSSESVLGEAMACVFYAWDAQNNRASDIIGKLTNCRSMYHHQVGLFGHYGTLYEDLPGIQWRTAALDNVWNNVNTADTAIAQHGIAFEAAVLDQMAGVGGLSATTVIDIANATGDKIYDGKSSNWTGSVKPNLTNYDPTTLTNIENWWINPGHRVCLPEDGAQTKNSWTGFGYFPFFSTGSALGIIGGSLKGGTGDATVTETVIDDTAVSNTAQIKSETFDGNTVRGSINLSSGQYFQGATDLTVGSMKNPYGLEFSRSYRSSHRMNDAGLGLGWTHNHQLKAAMVSDGLLSLGLEDPRQGAAGIVALFVSVDLNKDLTKPLDKFVTVVIGNQWLTDQIVDNVVLVNLAGEKKAFVRLPGGTFARPLLSASDLVDTGGGVYKMTSPQKVEYNFNTAGDISTIVYPEGPVLTYTYTSGKLSSVTNGMGRTLTFSYTGNQLSNVSDGTGRSITLTVNGSNNLTQVTDPNSKNTVYEYDQPGRMTKVFLPANPASPIVINTYDALNRVKEQRDAYNNLWKFYLAGSRAEEENPLGNTQIWYYNANGQAVRHINPVAKEWKTEYDGIGRKVKLIAPEGNRNEWTYDANHNPLTVRLVAKSGSGLSDIVNTFTYHSTFNKVATYVDGLGRTTTHSYDATKGTLLTIQRPQIGSPPQTPTLTFTYNTRGQVLTKTDETGMVTKFNYDATTERIDSIEVDDGAGRLNLTTSFVYNNRGDMTSVTDPRGKTSTATFDVLRRMTQVTASSPLNYVTKLEYDDNGNRTKVERETGDVLNPWQTFQATYRIDNLLATVLDPGSQIATFTYNTLRLPWKTTDAASRVTERTYDAAGRLSTIKDPSLTVEDTRTYNDNGKVSTIKDAGNNTTTFEYDGHDRLKKTIFPNSTYEELTFDANHNVLTKRMRTGNIITNTYDVLNRLATVAPQGQGTVTNVYDLAGRLTKTSKPVVSGDPSTGNFEFFFDTAGRLIKEKYPDTKEVQYQLDANGNVTKLTYPGGYYVDRTFDEINRLVDVKLNGAGSAALTFLYDKLSRRKKITYGNGVVTDSGYELDDDMNSLVQTFVGSAVTFTYGFNNVHELTSQQISDGANYSWHPASGGTTTYGTANNLNQYPTVGGTGYSYNNSGCLTGDGTWTFTYDTENHLLTANKTGTSVTNRYDPLHRQREHQVGSTKNRYIYAGWQRIADYNDTTLVNRYVYGTALDEPLIQVSSGGTLTYFHHDRQGSIIAISNASGTVTNRYKYSPFGESPSMTGTTFGYTGQRFESESGLYYYKYRYYSPKLGRFLQPDPIGYSDGLNLYSYAKNNPIGLKDPLGLLSQADGLASVQQAAIFSAAAVWNSPVYRTSLGLPLEVISGVVQNGSTFSVGPFSLQQSNGSYGSFMNALNAVAGPTTVLKGYFHSHPILVDPTGRLTYFPHAFSEPDMAIAVLWNMPAYILTGDGYLISWKPGDPTFIGHGKTESGTLGVPTYVGWFNPNTGDYYPMIERKPGEIGPWMYPDTQHMIPSSTIHGWGNKEWQNTHPWGQNEWQNPNPWGQEPINGATGTKV